MYSFSLRMALIFLFGIPHVYLLSAFVRKSKSDIPPTTRPPILAVPLIKRHRPRADGKRSVPTAS